MLSHMFVEATDLRRKIRCQEIRYAGNRKLGIYGKLSCFSGKRMKRENRVFFSSEEEAITNGYRPCGHCMKKQYKAWYDRFIQ
ncbi:hypothetical protein GCM10023231_40850 [Olivibacter ginsenosidimutans]|uniref:Ada DNA repair metal-binding domain-containing protein n=1 Tax=Olivibacter ginsenosidimutans TaxID=1176537 RepID=A0ABP9CBA3_9SPHI